MTNNPLTNQNKKVVFVAKNASVVAGELIHYGFPVDAGLVQPDLTYTVITSYAQLAAYITGGADTTQPWAVITAGLDANVRDDVVNRMRQVFGRERTVADALAVLNNEYAIKPELLR